jgi:hypothetical protein
LPYWTISMCASHSMLDDAAVELAMMSAVHFVGKRRVLAEI